MMDDIDEMEGENEAEEEEADEEEEDEGDAEEPEADADMDISRDHDPDGAADKSFVDGTDATGSVTADGPDATITTATTSATGAGAEAETGTSSTVSQGAADDARRSPSTPIPAARLLRPRPESVTARLYDIVPTMAAPQATSVNALSATPDMRYWITGGSDGYVRKYDGVATINGRQLLTVAQRHPFVDSVVKAGVLMSYWENEEPPTAAAASGSGGGGGGSSRGVLEEHVLSPVYSLAIHSQALWLLSGLESGGINLQSVRHDEGKRIHVLRDGGHTNAVSALSLAPDEKSVLSGSWDKSVLDWDLNNGHIIRRFDGSGGQISALEPRPESGAPIPAEAGEADDRSDTFQGNNGLPAAGGTFVNGINGTGPAGPEGRGDDAGGQGSPAHESLFGSPAGSTGSLFGDNDTVGGGGGFGGGEDDDEFSRAMEMSLRGEDDPPSAQHGMGQTEDFPMGEAGSSSAPAFGSDSKPPLAAQASLQGEGGDATETQTKGEDGTNESAPSFSFEASHDSFDFAQSSTAAATTVDDQSQLPSSQPAFPSPQQQQQNLPSQPSSQPQQQQQQQTEFEGKSSNPTSPSMLFSMNPPPPPHHDPTQSSSSTFLSASVDGTLRIWDRRAPNPVARVGNRPGVPPWCQGACWSPDGNWIYAGRRNGTVEEFNIHHARAGWQPERALKFPAGSGPVSCVRPMPNGRHLIW